MKGMSLAIETVIYIILAVMALTVLIVFFLSRAGPAQSQFEWEATRTNVCGQYTNRDPGCAKEDERARFNRDALRNLSFACSKLNYNGCSLNSEASLVCIQNCCLTCPKQR